VSNTQGDWHTYGVEWTDSAIVWTVDGQTVRTLQASDADGQFPQTPCQLRFGSWSGGDPSNPEGTIEWAQGPTDYSDGPFTMIVSSVSVVDYSTGTSYAYENDSGDWTSISSKGGRVNGNVGADYSDQPAPAVTGAAGSSIRPVWAPPVASGSATITYTNYPGLPSGWSVNPTSGKVIPPSAAPVSKYIANPDDHS
jgi:beta-glucanase (GH16 family)